MITNRTRSRRRSQRNRDGAVTVEFAFIAPLFVTLLAGMSQACFLLQVQNQFSVAAREGARTAAHDRDGVVNPGQTTNQKVESDIRAFLNANGLPGDDVDITIAEANDADVPFDLDDPDNDLRYFQVIIEHPLSDLMNYSPPGTDEMVMSARIVFRNGRATIVQ